MTNDATAEIEFRISRAWCTFSCYRDFLCTRRIPFAKRVAALHRTVVPTLLHGIGTLNMTQRHMARLRATENHMMRLMLRKRSDLPAAQDPLDIDPAEDYMSLTNSLLNTLRTKHNWERWDCMALARVHTWAGHLARFREYAPQRWALRTLLFKGIHYLRVLEKAIGTQGHPHRFRVWRWEQQFTRWYGDSWMDQAQDQEAWADTRTAWLRGRHNWQKQ